MTNVQFEPTRYLIRPGQDDHKELERLLTPGYWQKQPAEIDGIVLDAPFAHRLGEPLKTDPLRNAIVDKSTMLLVDPHGCRLADGNWRPEAVEQLPYSRRSLFGDSSRGFAPEDFGDQALVQQFVRTVLDFQSALSASDYLAPAFYLEGPDSPWAEVNNRILREAIRQAGIFVYAMFCGSLAALEDARTISDICHEASSVYALVSPLNARDSSVTKLLRFVNGLEAFRANAVGVIAGRQPAFGLSLMALGLSGFDGGLARIESFDYRSMVREVKRDRDGSRGGGRSRPIYATKLMTSVPRDAAAKLLEMPGMRSQLTCNGLCCKDNMTDALQAAREHFVWSRLEEIRELREIAPAGRVRHMAERLAGAHQLSKRVERLLPDERWHFKHLDDWSRVLEVVGAGAVARREE